MTDKIKKCPFCGSSAEIVHYSDSMMGLFKYARVRCTACGSKGPEIQMSMRYSADDKAVETWNRRTNEESPRGIAKDTTTTVYAGKDIDLHYILQDMERSYRSMKRDIVEAGSVAELTIYRKIRTKEKDK